MDQIRYLQGDIQRVQNLLADAEQKQIENPADLGSRITIASMTVRLSSLREKLQAEYALQREEALELHLHGDE